MSAVELLKQVKALPPRTRAQFVLAVLDLDEKAVAAPKRNGKRVKWPDVQARAARIFGKRVLPNLVLLEREEQAL